MSDNIENYNIGGKFSISFSKSAFISNDNRNKFVFEEKRKKYTAINKKNKYGICLKIDGGLYFDKVKKCDKGLLLEDKRFFLIELKGVNSSDACKQLLNTINLLEKDYKQNTFDFYCRIVAKKGLPKSNTNEQNLKKKLNSSIKLKIRENNLIENIN